MSEKKPGEIEPCQFCGGRIDHRHVLSEPLLPDGPLTSYEKLKSRNKVLTAALLKQSGLTEEQLVAAVETIVDTAKETQAVEKAKRARHQSAASSSPHQPEVPAQRGEHGEGVRELGRAEPPVDGGSSEAGESSGETPA
jgi:hypothetical protein